jgi:hypothetical protein
LANAKVQPLLKIDERILAPNRVPNLIPRDHLALVAKKKSQDPCRLLLNTDWCTPPAQFECLLI